MGKDWDKFIPHDEVEMHPRWANAKRADPAEANWGDGPMGRLPNYGGRRSTYQCEKCGKRDAFRKPHRDCGDDGDWRRVPSYAGAPADVLAFEKFSEAWAAEAYRILKPGGHLLAFGATRMYHRLAAGIEDAGFEIRDSLHWIYGCLTADVEVLTEAGWKRGADVAEGELVAQWDPETEAVSLAPVLETFSAPWAGPMRVFRNADTDQMVTPNHRVYHRTAYRRQRDGVRPELYPEQWDVAEAADVTRYAKTILPTSGFADGPGVGGVEYAELLAWVWTEGGFDKKGSGVRIYQSSSANPGHTARIDALVRKLVPTAKRYDRDRVYESRHAGPVTSSEACWFFSGDAALRVRADLPEKMPTYSLLWRMTLAEKVAFLDAAMAGDGSGNGFEQKGREPLEWFQTLAHLVGWSARVRMREARSTGACSLRRSGTTQMQARHFQASYDAHYEGSVWCIRVPTGAFLARRNGLVFVTGNSGFPKSLDVSKAIDKKMGAERPDRVVSDYGGNDVFSPTRSPINKGTPVTEEAQTWDGWGTALKPAHEPIVMARKPLSGTVSETVLAHGTGALNIAATRAGDSGGIKTLERPKTEKAPSADRGGTDFPPHATKIEHLDAGRWPANILLAHLPECEGNGAKHTDVLCAPGCPVAEMNEMSGDSASPVGPLRYSQPSTPATPGAANPESVVDRREVVVEGYGDAGGAARFFYIAKPRTRERIGGTIRNLHPCLAPESLVVTDGGYREISLVKVGDRVLADDGTFRTVLAAFPTPCSGPLVEVEVEQTNLRARATRNHPFLIWRPERQRRAIVGGSAGWVEAADIQVGDYTMTPTTTNFSADDSGHNEEWWWMAGLWLAEGSFLRNGNRSSRYPVFSLADHEHDLVARLRRVFGEVSRYERDDHGVTIVAFQSGVADELEHLCGSGARTKVLAPEVLALAEPLRRAFFDGYVAGDGCEVRGGIAAKTSSRELAPQLALLGESLGYRSCLYEFEDKRPRQINGRAIVANGPYYQVFFNDGERLTRPRFLEEKGQRFSLRRVKRVTEVPYDGDVWNLTVDGAHTFQTAVGMTHNTVKPIDLMRYLVRLVTPPGGVIVDPFLGSGTTGCAAMVEGFRFVGIEQDAESYDTALARISDYAFAHGRGKPLPE